MERKGVIDNIQVDCKYVPKANCAYSQSWFDYKGVRYRLDHSWGCHSPKLPTAGHIRELIWKDLVVIAGL